MTVKRITLALLVAAGLLFASSAAPASAASTQTAPAAAVAQVAQQGAARVGECSPAVMGVQTNYFQIHNSFYCLGYWRKIGPYGPTSGSFCLDLSGFTDASFPAPNGISNIMSSGFNQTEHRLEFYDAFNCAGPVLFAMQPNTYRDTLVAAANNKASSFKLINV